MKIILIGPTGSGKGTQAKFIANLLKIKHIDVGENFREMGKKNKLIRKLVNDGLLVPDRFVIGLINGLIRNKRSYILDGFPRKLSQAKKFRDEANLVLFLDVNKKNLVKRLLLRKREDDTTKNIVRRYKIFLKYTMPVINYYKRKGVLIKINGNPSINQVSKNIKKTLTQYSNSVVS